MVSLRKKMVFFGSLAACALLLMVLIGIKASILLLSRRYTPTAAAAYAPLPDHPLASATRGAQLTHGILGCTQCHGPELRGGVLFDDKNFGTVAAPDLHRQHLDDAHLYAALRFGIDSAEQALWLMPSDALSQLGAADLAAVMRYLQTLPPSADPAPRGVDKQISARGRVRLALGWVHLTDSASSCRRPLPATPTPAPHAPYGGYLGTVGRCLSCHRGRGDGASAKSVVPGLMALEMRHGAGLQPLATALSPQAFAQRLQQAHRTGQAPAWHNYSQIDTLQATALHAWLREIPAS